MSEIYGYCRCSTDDRKQDVRRQVRELKEMGAIDETIYTEYISGTSVNKIELNRLLEAIPDGGTIVVTEISRISRSTKQLLDLSSSESTETWSAYQRQHHD